MSTPRSVLVLLALGLLAASQSGNLIRIGDASAVAIAAWRLALASLVLLPFVWRGLPALRRLGRKELALLVLGGLALSAHFIAWIAGVQETTVAHAQVTFAVNPLSTSLAAWILIGERPSRRLWIAIALGMAGILVIAWHDLDAAPDRFRGDLVVLLSALCFTAYFLVGRRLRRFLEAPVYACVLYAIASLPCFLLFPFLDIPFVDHGAQNWVCFGLLALVPTVVGHTSFAHALRWIPPNRVSTATLTEPLLGGAVAWMIWDEPVSGATVAGYVLICASVGVLLWDRGPTPTVVPLGGTG
ncbi:MAG: DMT family transporter [Deltaproteobacteria bacterium]|nr:DMT family transporter [Deltaproteobacteria bacterium]